MSAPRLPQRPAAQTFHAGEQSLQQRWQTEALWDEARRNRLLWDHIPAELHPRLESAPFFFLATSSPDGRCDCSFKGGGPLRALFPDSPRVIRVDVEQVVPNCTKHIPRLIPA